jgi:hypothetical protein
MPGGGRLRGRPGHLDNRTVTDETLAAVETLEFQAEARQLLHLVVHSIYSN